MFEHILIPTDGTATSEGAVTIGIGLATEHNAKVHALYVVKTDSSLGHFDIVVERREARGERAVDAVEAQAQDADVPVEKVFRYGGPANVIPDYAQTADIDLVVMGTPSRSGIRQLIHPRSAAERVVRAADVPVLTVSERVGEEAVKA